MIKLETNYAKGKNDFQVKYSCKEAITLEHIHAIRVLIEKILEKDPFMTVDDLKLIIESIFEGKEGNGKNGK